MPETRHTSLRAEQTHGLAHNEHTPAHSHEMGHVVYPAAGVLTVITDRGAWIAPATRAVWIPAGVEHEHRAHGSTDMRVVFMDARFAQLLPDHAAVLAVTPLAREAVLALAGPQQRSQHSRDRLRHVLVEEAVAAHQQPLHLPVPRDDRVRAVAQIVEAELASPSTLAELGRRVGAGERTLTRLFLRETGMNFRQWRTQLRVHRALLMLADGVPVVDVGVACGWSNPSAFIEAFTALVGRTPGRYQRTLPAPGTDPLPGS